MRHPLCEKAYFAALCVIMLSGILAAGLAPFGSPVNGVERKRAGEGFAWTAYSIAIGAAPLLRQPPQDPSLSVELRLRPAEADRTRTLLAFYDQQHPRWFRLRQSDADVDLSAAEGGDITFVETKDFFEEGQLVHLTVTSGARGTAFYSNGTLVATDPSANISSRILTGTMLLGNSATDHDSWHGEILGLAIFNQELTATQVLRHFQTWNHRRGPELDTSERPVGLFLFGESSGRVLRNRWMPDASFGIPEKYEVPLPKLLVRPWREFRTEWSYLRDVLINLAGFVPFGFALRSYLVLTAVKSWSSGLAGLTGSAVSLLIEITQSHLPTRDSSLTDVITNSLGNWAGVMIAAQFPKKT